MRCQVDSKHPWNAVTVLVLYLRDLPLQNPETQSNYEKNIGDTPREGLLLNTWTVMLKTVKVIKDKESLRNCHS